MPHVAFTRTRLAVQPGSPGARPGPRYDWESSAAGDAPECLGVVGFGLIREGFPCCR